MFSPVHSEPGLNFFSADRLGLADEHQNLERSGFHFGPGRGLAVHGGRGGLVFGGRQIDLVGLGIEGHRASAGGRRAVLAAVGGPS